VLSADDKGIVRVWDIKSGRELSRFEDHGGWTITSMALSSNDSTAISAGYDRVARVWSIDGGEKGLQLDGHESIIEGVAISEQNHMYVTGGRDGTRRFWRSKTGDELATLTWGRS
jgi:WD40 repeat protein